MSDSNLSRSGADSTVRSAMRNRLWSKSLLHEFLDKLRWKSYIGKGSNALIRENDDFVTRAGDEYIFGLSKEITGDPVIGDDEREGREALLDIFNDSVFIDQMFKPVMLVGEMEEQRVAYNLRKDARFQLSRYMSTLAWQYIVDHISGNVAMSPVFPTGHGPTTATTNKRMVVDASEAQDHTWTGTTGIYGSDDLTAADKLTVEDIIIAQFNAYNPATSTVLKTSPISVDDAAHYLHITEPTALHWLERDPVYQQYAREAGLRGKKNVVFTGALNMIHGVIIVSEEKLRRADNTNSVACSVNVLLGRNAGILAKADKATKWKEKFFDWDNKFGVGASMKWGMHKTVFDSEDFGTYTVLCASPTPARSTT